MGYQLVKKRRISFSADVETNIFCGLRVGFVLLFQALLTLSQLRTVVVLILMMNWRVLILPGADSFNVLDVRGIESNS
jgi:hypothetical protein